MAFELGEYEFYDAVLNEDWDELSLDRDLLHDGDAESEVH